ncbi:hypothetical protein Asn12ST33_10755 [Cutibacterium acnes]|nr:hypothetical protein Asn12ST33_10755 [Cutibacterium acnes]
MAVIAAAWGAPRFHLDHMDRLVTTTMREYMGFPISSWRDAQTCIFGVRSDDPVGDSDGWPADQCGQSTTTIGNAISPRPLEVVGAILRWVLQPLRA